MEKISIVVPCYNEEASLPIFYKVITEELEKMKVKYELIFIDDGSKDNTLNILRKLVKDTHVRYISFSRNFGKEAAMYAGLESATGDYVAPMDVDLQDPPSLLPKMYELITTEDYDCIGTRRVTRKGEPAIRSFFARMFYKLINKISKVPMVDGARDFRLMKRNMVNSILELKEYNRYSKGIFSFVGFKTKWLEYENIERVAGTTKWNFWKLFVYAIEGIISFSTVPLMFGILLGLISLLVSFVLFLVMCFNGFLSIILISTLLFLLFGFTFILFGIIGMYLSKVFLEIKNRPIYIVREKR
ncbi:MAG: glycosyltransferase family 2 protein [Bacilli bacterium]